MQKAAIFFIALFYFAVSVSFMSPKNEEIQWITFTQLQEEYHKNPRPVLIDVYTHWCGWCKVMDKQTYSNDAVAHYINTHYYAVRFDAETKDSVTLAGKHYTYDPAYKANDLALYLTGGQLTFPTTVFLTDIKAQPAPLAGFLKPKELEPPLKYFGDGIYKTKSYADFAKTFKASW